MMSVSFHIISLFPELISAYLQEALLQKAISKNLLSVNLVQLRDFSDNKYKSIDDTVYGGSDGMIFRADILEKALLSLPIWQKHRPTKVVYLSPQGKVWNHQKAHDWALNSDTEYVLISGRYGGIDQRFIDQYVDEEISIGQYVLSGGELAALTVIESVSRFIPGVLGHAQSSLKDSFSNQLLEAPQYTKPSVWNQRCVPSVLMSGHHQKIQDWSDKMQLLMTLLKMDQSEINFSDQQLKALNNLKNDIKLKADWLLEVFQEADLNIILGKMDKKN